MLIIKSAQIPDFTDVSVRRIFGYAFNQLQSQMTKLQEAQQGLISTSPNIQLEELRQNTELWNLVQGILGEDHWSFKGNTGIIQ